MRSVGYEESVEGEKDSESQTSQVMMGRGAVRITCFDNEMVE